MQKLEKIRAWIAGAAVIWSLASAAAAQPDITAANTRIDDAQYALDQGRPAEAKSILQALMADRVFAALSPHNQQTAIFELASANAREPGCESALADAHRAADAADAPASALNTLLAQIYSCDDYAGAAGVLETVIVRAPRVTRGLSDNVIYRATPYLHTDALRYLINNGWDHDTTLDLTPLRLQLIRRLLGAGAQNDAVTVAHEMAQNVRADLNSLVIFLADKTFDSVVAADPHAFTFEAMSQRALANVEADSAAAPDKLVRINTLGEMLLVMTRASEARVLVDDALARAQHGAPGHPAFSDLDGNLNWTHDLKARLLEIAGDGEGAAREMQAGASHTEDGRSNVSQTLNHAGMLLSGGNPEAALGELNRFDLHRASPYGRGVARRMRVCAYADLGDDENMHAALAEMSAHAHDSLLQLRAAAQCAGDADLVASTYLQELADPVDRADAITRAQSFLDYDPGQSFLSVIGKRDDVHTAMDQAMHVRSFPINLP